ncbi:unnamed protein product [Gemmataceae bacterium]|nr:unnamed protein product [Gemmataceae bacterium]VTT97891.1 unnamed protein product [Gemmataceae bacterium]
MQVTPSDVIAVAASAPPSTVRVVTGSLASVPVGVLVPATVRQASPREAVLDVGGQSVTVRPGTGGFPTGIEPGTVLAVKVPGTGANSALDLVGRVATSPGPLNPPGAPSSPGPRPSATNAAHVPPGPPTGAPGASGPLAPQRVAVVEVLGSLPDGRVRVRFDGGEALATPAARLSPGNRYAVQVEQTPGGLTLRPAVDGAGRQLAPIPVQPQPPRAADPAPATVQVSPPRSGPGIPTTQAPAATPGPAAPAAPAPAPTAAPLTAAPERVAVVDVLGTLPDGRVRVRIDGAEVIASSGDRQAAPLGPGRHLVQVERTPGGVVLRPAAEPPPTAVAAAVLRAAPPPNVPATLKPLLTELAALQVKDPAARTDPAPPAVRAAAAAVSETIRTLLPSDARPPNPAELRNLVENGGLHFEAKLARDATALRAEPQPAAPPPGAAARPEPEPGPRTDPAPARPAGDPATAPAPRTDPHRVSAEQGHGNGSPPPGHAGHGPVGPDLKGDLLRLIQTVHDLGGAAAEVPVARTALNGIEVQQALNTLAQAQGTPYVLQVPFPDGDQLRTLHLALEPDRSARPDDRPGDGGFRLLMHVPLSDLGETWIDAGLVRNRFRAVLYLDQPETRDRVQAALPGLREELIAGGFDEVLLDVRPTRDLPAARRQQGAAMRSGRPGAGSVLDVRA